MMREQRNFSPTLHNIDIGSCYLDHFKIVHERCTMHIKKIRQIMKTLKIVIPPENIHYDLVLEREMLCYNRKLFKLFHKRYPRDSYLIAMFKAHVYDKDFFRIIEFDRAWLYTEWAKEKILKAQEDGDYKFLRKLGEAIGREPRVKPPKDKDYQRVLDYAEAYLDSWKSSSPGRKLPRGSVHKLFELFCKEYEDYLPESFREENNFRKFLKRNNITPPSNIHQVVLPNGSTLIF